jgi:ribonuclease HI
MSEAVIHIDGAARGNPGPAAYAVVIEQPGKDIVERSAALGTATNNVAEYKGLLAALEAARELGLKTMTIFSDSELLVKQMSGEYRVKNPDLQTLFEEANRRRREFQRVEIRHVRREQNKRADELCNIVLDGPKKKAAGVPVKPKAMVSDDAVRGDALLCLASAAKAWAASAGKTPPPALVWDQLWSILEEGGVLRKVKK